MNFLHQYIRTLQSIVSRKGSSKILTFSVPHVLKAVQFLDHEYYVSRASFCSELKLGEGAVKTLINHLKENGMVDSARSGTFLTEKGKKFARKIFTIIPAECSLKKCKIAPEKFNHAILLRDYSSAIKNGIEQRDYAIMYGATFVTTLKFKNNRFTFPAENFDSLADDEKTKVELIRRLGPHDGDVVIISSAKDPFVAEISAKNSAIWTLATHEKH